MVRVASRQSRQQPGSALEALQVAADALDVAVRMLPRVEALPGQEVVAVLDAAAAVDRLSDAVMVQVAGVVTARSDGVDPDESLARQAGALNARQLLARATGHRTRDVKRLQRLARATEPTVSLTGATVQAGFAFVGAALHAGAVSLDQADSITTLLAQAAPRCHPDDLVMAEQQAVALATGTATGPDEDAAPMPPLSAEDTAKIAMHLRDRLDPDGIEPTHDAHLAQRSLRVAERSDGMIAGSFLLPPVDGAILLQALQAFGKPGTKPRFLAAIETKDDADTRSGSDADTMTDAGTDADADTSAAATDGAAGQAGLAVVDDRTTPQRDADTMMGLITRAIELADTPRIGGAAPTLVVTITQDARDANAAGDTTTHDGRPAAATITHTGTQIPAHIAEAIACDGDTQIMTQDHQGHPLHLGRTTRLFPPAIRRAVTIRDRRCVGCGKPAGFCQTHHITWWSDGGTTDIDNALLVCDWCHHEIHRGRLHPTRQPDGHYRLTPTIAHTPRYRRAA